MFGFLNPASGRGKQLAELLKADRSRLMGEFAGALVNQGPSALQGPLIAFQAYCIRATAAKRSYGKQNLAILEYAVGTLFRDDFAGTARMAADSAWVGFETDEAGCRDLMARGIFTNFDSLPADAQKIVEVSFDVFHQCTKLSIASVLKDTALFKEVVAAAPKLELTPEQMAELQAACSP